MKRNLFFIFLWLLGVAALSPLDHIRAEPTYAGGDNHVSYSLTYAPVIQFDTDLDDGGRFDVSRHLINLEVKQPKDRKLTLGAGISYDRETWNFEQSADVAGASPWEDVQRIGIRLPISYAFKEDWIASVALTVESAGESGAKVEDSLTYGGVAFVLHPINRDLLLGFGFGLFSGLEESSLFPFIVVNWKITDNLRLSNPFEAGPVGPAGLELIYAPSEKWEFGIGGGFRNYRFRLDEDNAVSGGVAENEFLATFARVQRKLNRNWDVDLVGGMLLNGGISIDDKNGDNVGTTSYDPSSFVAITIRAGFSSD